MSFTQRPAVVMEGACRSPVQQEKEWREGVRTPGLLWSYSGPELSGTPAGVHSGALRPGVLTPLRGCVRMDLLRSGARRLRPNFAPEHPGPLRWTTPVGKPHGRTVHGEPAALGVTHCARRNTQVSA